jgi:hypothetical protein
MTQRGRSWTIVLGLSLAISPACQRNTNMERAALQKEAKALDARHATLDDEVAGWSESVGRWIKENNVSIDPAQIVLSLSSQSFFLHEPQHTQGAGAGPGYAHLEEQWKQIQTKRRAIEADWSSLLSRSRAANERAGIKSTGHEQSFDIGLGDSTIPIPGVSARASCCRLTIDLPALGTTCRFVKERCERVDNKTWRRVCEYECDPIVLDIR